MIVRAFVIVIHVYQRLISPLFGDRCRFFPTCSQYSIEALRRHGSLKGTKLTIVRLAKCGPWNPGGIDPVP